MSLSLQNDTTFTGPALPEPFVRLQLEAELTRLGLLPRTTGEEGRALAEFWRIYRAHLRLLVSQGGSLRVRNQAVEPLLSFAPFGYTSVEDASEVTTREGHESGGCFLTGTGGTRLRCWTAPLGEDLDAPARRGEAYRFSHGRIASRVLLATSERIGLLANGAELRLLICDPARLDTTISIALDSSWKRQREVPDSFRLFLALACPNGVKALPDLLEKARLQQQKVTKDLRVQARLGVRDFLQAILDHPENSTVLDEHPDKDALARSLWREGLVTVYRLLFILKVESTDDPAKALGFASGSLWRNTFSPTIALAPLVRAAIDRGEATGRLMEDGLRNLFRLFSEGVECTEMTVRPMGGGLFDSEATPLLSRLRWSELAVAQLLNHLLWTEPRRGASARERVHYGPLDVEDLGKVYEALLELEPGIATEPMCRLRRAKLEVVVPIAQGDRYRPVDPITSAEDDDDEGEDSEEEEASGQRGGTKVEWIEEIHPGSYFLRVGLGRKATGSYYTPESFVRFLVQETLGPLVDRVSPRDDPQPTAILKLKVVDKAMGSGHFLVGAARYLGDRLYEACRRCDELASQAEWKLEHQAPQGEEREATQRQLDTYRTRLGAIPDPDQEVVRYLPSRVLEGVENGYSQRKAIALCRRLIAVHCLYGVDRNPLAVELAKLSLWIECHAEGLPLTFLDHRLVLGDSLTGPFFEHLLRYPISGEPLDDLFTRGLREKLTAALANALVHVRELEASAGVTLAEVEAKRAAKDRLDRSLSPFKILAAAWSGGVMLGSEHASDTDYAALVRAVAETGGLPEAIAGNTERLCLMISKGLGLSNSSVSWLQLLSTLNSQVLSNCVPALPFDLAFPEVFYPDGNPADRAGFNADLGNPPWDAIQFKSKEFFAAFDFEVLNAHSARARDAIIGRLLQDEDVRATHERASGDFDSQKRINDILYEFQKVFIDGDLAGRYLDAFRVFMERSHQVLSRDGAVGVVVPSAFHGNAGAVGVRRLFLQKMRLRFCFSFENRRQLFEIHRSFKFAVVVADKGGSTNAFACAFYLHDDEWLFSDRSSPKPFSYSMQFVEKTGGPYLTFLELQNPVDAEIAERVFNGSVSLAEFGRQRGLVFQVIFNISLEAERMDVCPPDLGDVRRPENRTRLVQGGAFYLSEGKTFHQFDELWGDPPRFIIPFAKMGTSALWQNSGRFYRLGFRTIARSTDERTGIFALLSPGTISGHSVIVERSPERVPRSWPLIIAAFGNAFAFDWCLRLMTSANVSLFIMNQMPVPNSREAFQFLAHSALRLTCHHSGYASLWREQLGEVWREAGTSFTWPVLSGDNVRWGVRAAIDAVVANAYGLTREHYAHVLGTFSHSSYPAAKILCLERFDELQRDGLAVFTRRHDPYNDIPLNESLPQPVIDLSVPSATMAVAEDAQGELGLEAHLAPTPRRRGRRRLS
jgi:hypothetical protein